MYVEARGFPRENYFCRSLVAGPALYRFAGRTATYPLSLLPFFLPYDAPHHQPLGE